ncbi:MAG: glycosyltransferase family 2 protein [Candidatus Acidiferrales bacterium]
MSSPGITVLITTYNYGRFIEEAIESVLSQDYPADKMEIVVVDDGSTDDTAERVKKYESKIKYFQKPNGGQASALNFGFARARGEIIALLDADDFFLPGKLACVTEAFQSDPALGMVYHSLQEWNTQTNERHEANFPLISGDIRTVPGLFFSYYPHPTSCVSFRRTSLARLLPIPEVIRMIADAYLVNLIPFLSSIRAVPESFIVYRIHGENSLPYFANVYQADESQMPIETREARLRRWQIVIDAMRKWLVDNGYTRRQIPVRTFLDCWALWQKKERFLIKPPGRARFFWFVVFENYAASPLQSWKLTAYNYLSALSALIFGYKKAHQMYEWRKRGMEMIQRWFEKPLRTRR